MLYVDKIKYLLISLRPKQWIKNLFVFVPLLFFGKLCDMSYLLLVSLSFMYFCFISSAVYLINDVIDREKDKLHPIKSKRPIAHGKISPQIAIGLSIFLIIYSFLGIYLIKNNFLFGIAAAYIILNLFYNFVLKNTVILDVISVAIGFELRIWAGSVIIGITPSAWLQVFTFILALFISFAKRREEMLSLKKVAIGHRGALSGYRIIFLDQLIAICGGIIILAYALYALSWGILKSPRGDLVIYTIPFVVYGVFRYMYLMYIRKEGGDPAEIVFSDKPMLTDLLLWLLAIFLILYL